MKYTKPNGREDDTHVIGDYPTTKLKQTREQRDEARVQLAEGKDPKEERRLQEIQKQHALGNTFKAVALVWHEKMTAKWSADYATRFLKRLENNLFPEIGDRPISKLKTRDLMLSLKMIEKRNAPAIAERMKQAITGVMRYAVQEGYINSNPAPDLKGAITPRETVHRPALRAPA